MAKEKMNVEELVNDVRDNKLRLPEMQRGYVWTSTKVRDLIDSLYRGYPTGNILMWETSEPIATRDFADGVAHNQQITHSSYNLLLDGQQRITSLARLLDNRGVTVRDRKHPIDILFNLDHPETITSLTPDEQNDDADADIVIEGDSTDDDSDSDADPTVAKQLKTMRFIVATKALQNDPKWVSVRKVFSQSDNADFLKRAGVQSFDDPLFDKYNNRLTQLRGILKYEFSVIGLGPDRDYEEVVEIFIRVNSLGTKLKGSDLALAQITAKWNGSLKLFEQFQQELSTDVSIGTIVRSLNTTITGQARFDKVGNLTRATLEDNWPTTQENIKASIDFLKTFIPISLISPYFVVLLAWWVKQKRDLNNRLKQWVILANLKGRYSRGSTETLLDQDLKAENADQLFALLKKQFGSLDITPDDLAGRNTNSGYFTTMFLAMKWAGARDWRSDLEISIEHLAKRNKIEFHHIFPKAYLRGTVPDAEINDIANLAFIGSETNKWIRDRAPEKYLTDLKQENPASFDQLLHAQRVPNDPELWQKLNFAAFITQRRRQITELFDEYLGSFSR
jgi:hypothetical protein